jgi:hypothetical protein
MRNLFIIIIFVNLCLFKISAQEFPFEECYGEDTFLASQFNVAFVKRLHGNDPRYWKTASLIKQFKNFR